MTWQSSFKGVSGAKDYLAMFKQLRVRGCVVSGNGSYSYPDISNRCRRTAYAQAVKGLRGRELNVKVGRSGDGCVQDNLGRWFPE